MARLPRLDLPGIPQHIVQRGNNRLPCFLDDEDRLRYLLLLADALPRSGCQLHAYVLMDNHVHLLLTPNSTGAIGKVMQRLGRNYVGLFNVRHQRTGTLWEGRYKASLVDSDDYLLRCMRYIELNPVRAAMVANPSQYAWSSCRAHLGLRPDTHLTHHPQWLALGSTVTQRATWWQQFLQEATTDLELEQIRITLQQQRAFGSSRFHASVEAKTQRFAGTRPAHRPSKNKNGQK